MTLEEVKEAFELWRASRIKRGPIPEVLWSMVQALLPYYKKSRIIEALKINRAQLKLGCQKNLSPDKTEQNDFAIGYFRHQPSSMMEQQTQQQCELILKGARMNLQMNINISQLTHVLPLIEHYL